MLFLKVESCRYLQVFSGFRIIDRVRYMDYSVWVKVDFHSNKE